MSTTSISLQAERGTEPDLERRLQDLRGALLANRPDTATAIYTEDAVVAGFPFADLPFTPVSGRTEIGRMWAAVPITAWTLESLAVRVTGDRAQQFGRSTVEVDGHVSDTAFVGLWRRDPDGEWRLYADVFKPWETAFPAPAHRGDAQ